jgi:hypothetical protein
LETTAELITQLRTLGHKLDSATDPAVMRFLITARRALMPAIEASRTPAVLLTLERQAARRLRNRPATTMAPIPNPISTTLEGSGTVPALLSKTPI